MVIKNGRWQMAGGRWKEAGGRWQEAEAIHLTPHFREEAGGRS
jgi:hypothetical protein